VRGFYRHPGPTSKGGKWRDIDLVNEARKPLYEYLQATRDPDREYVFLSQRNERLTEEGIHHWFRTLKARATKDQWEHIADLTFHDLRHDFAHRAREAGWTLEEVAYYLGHVTKKGTPAIQTTVRYTCKFARFIGENVHIAWDFPRDDVSLRKRDRTSHRSNSPRNE